jgi:L-threonylcarbamoyladenylate synthase
VTPELERVVAALRDGASILIPTDTVYGLAADASSPDAVGRLYRLKGREAIQPTAVVFASVAQLVEHVPEVDERMARGLLPGPLTLIVPNPVARYRWVCGPAGSLGIRVPVLAPGVVDVLQAFGPVVATSANLPGGIDPRCLDDVPAAIAEGAAAVIDGGELPGTPSTVVDLSGAEPVVIREGAVPEAELRLRLSTV